ncbi:hypothetical protein HTZ84_11385 [Haloterrigena sp. SYSU A558-1]|uniref:Cox cluster protein n=1 Tax=Haloterrigena gelatinilytica TaxID=2741724 RepID=A0A8J8GKJ6_9EURY|nr:hypothetical protein [Haloterrigena gelatinilytica]NUB91356.1 hypothetical protein [Haloterrigena gelatinilytica]NUC72905.1 hypothetical protein [Haloterrigena gelatinilytica]
MTADRRLGGRRVVGGLCLVLIAATATFGAILGYALPVMTDLEEITVLEVVVPVTPATFALYGGVTVGVFLVTFLLVVQFVSRFDENAV